MVQNPFSPEGSSKIGNPFAVQEGSSVNYLLIALVVFVILLLILIVFILRKKKAGRK